MVRISTVEVLSHYRLLFTNKNEIHTTRQTYKVTRSARGNSPREVVSSVERPGSTYRALRRHRDPMRSDFHVATHSYHCTSHNRSSVLVVCCSEAVCTVTLIRSDEFKAARARLMFEKTTLLIGSLLLSCAVTLKPWLNRIKGKVS
jgi:hypothetical protein